MSVCLSRRFCLNTLFTSFENTQRLLCCASCVNEMTSLKCSKKTEQRENVALSTRVFFSQLERQKVTLSDTWDLFRVVEHTFVLSLFVHAMTGKVDANSLQHDEIRKIRLVIQANLFKKSEKRKNKTW